MTNARCDRLVVCMPVFNDWESAQVVVSRVDTACADAGIKTSFVLVDDGSTDPAPQLADWPVSEPEDRVRRIRLVRNLGHQRAIVIGLAAIAREQGFDAVVVMDSDGEDIPEQVPALCERALATDMRSTVFAKRARRSEGLQFQLGYLGFRLVHRLLTGRKVEIGNFSLIPAGMLPSVLAVGETWTHYAAGVTRSRLPMDTVPLDRGTRIAGRSKMNVVSLVGHGLGALSIFAEEIAVRMLAALALLAVIFGVGFGVAVATKSGHVAIVAAVGVLVSLAVVVQGVLASVMLYRLKSLTTVVPIDSAQRWIADVAEEVS